MNELGILLSQDSARAGQDDIAGGMSLASFFSEGQKKYRRPLRGGGTVTSMIGASGRWNVTVW